MSGLFIVIFLAGFNIRVVVFAFTFLKVQAGISWPKAGIATAIIWGITFPLFEVALGSSLFKGLLFGELVPDL